MIFDAGWPKSNVNSTSNVNVKLMSRDLPVFTCLTCELSTRESRDQLQSDHSKAQFILLRRTYAETHRPTPEPAQRPNVKWWFNVMIWYLLAAVMAIILLQRTASSSALAIVLWVIQATCPWTLHGRRRRTIGPVPNGTLNPRSLPLSPHFHDVMLLWLSGRSPLRSSSQCGLGRSADRGCIRAT